MKRYFFKFRLIPLFFIFSLLISVLSVFAVSAASDTPDLTHAENVYLYNFESGKVLIEKNADSLIFPGAAAKIVTALIAFECLWSEPDREITVTPELLAGSSGASMKLEAGMTVSVRDLMYGLICGGGNDAAFVLARLCSTDTEAFVTEMNSFAEKLGARSTHFTNPAGIDEDGMYSTLSDISVFCKAALKNSDYMKMSNVKSYIYTPRGSDEEIKIFNRNSLVGTYYASGYQNNAAEGIIAGVTDRGGYFVSAFAELSGATYLCIVAGADGDDGHIYSYEIINGIFDHARHEYSYEKIAASGDIICKLPVENSTVTAEDGELPEFDCMLGDDIFVLMMSGSDIVRRYYFHEDSYTAPMNIGDIVGGVDYLRDGEVIASSPLLLGETVEENSFVALLDSMKGFFLGRFFIISLLAFLVLFFIYYYNVELKHRRKKVKNIQYKNFY